MKTSNLMSLIISILIICLFSSTVISQPFLIGHKQITFNDPARSNRAIQTEIYYPATAAGDNTPFASGQFPLIVYGHGFVMVWSAYQWMWDSIVPYGYIMAFPRTEGSISPTHSEFGLDLAFLNTFIKSENTNNASFFYQHVTNESAIMGHSMGGGASFLAAANNSNLTTLINFAAANTTPSSITAALNVTVPILMFSGENDGVAPPATHQIPMYNSCASQCKTHITLLGGGHCYFADYNFNCSFGEGTTSPQPTITMDEQHVRTFYMLLPYLDFMLKNNVIAGNTFLNRLASNIDITYVRNCNTSGDNQNYFKKNIDFKCIPNPADNFITIQTEQIDLPAIFSIFDIAGRKIMEQMITYNNEEFSVESLEAGSYFITFLNAKEISTQKIIIK